MARKNCDGLQNWTKEDKLLLFQGIKTYGSDSTDQINESFPFKTKEDIDKAIIFFKRKALEQENISRVIRERNSGNNLPYVPLNSWAKLLTETFPFNELYTETATALRLIGDFEDIPSALCTEKVDFRKVYYTMANALEGKALCEDKFVASVIDKCVVETALTSKAFMKCAEYKNALKEIKINEKELSPFMKPTESDELSVLQHLITSRNYNPLNISEKNLKFSATS